MNAASPRSPHRHAITAVALLTLIAAFFAAGQASDVVIQTVLTDGLLALAWIAGMTGWGSLFSRRLLTIRHDEPAGVLILATWAGVGIGGVSLAILGLGSAGRLGPGAAWAILLGGLILFAARLWQATRALDRPLRFYVGPISWIWVATAPAIAVLIVSPVVLPGVLWGDEPHGYDVISYHLQIPREWHESGRINTLGHNVFSYFPLAMETHYLLAMHLRGGPWAGMYLAQFMHATVAAATAAAAYGAMRPRGQAPATIAGALTLATPWTAMLGGVAYNEGGLMLLGTLAIAWALRADAARLHDNARGGYTACFVAGVATGLAYGFKMTAAAMIAAPLAVVLLASPKVIRRRPVMLAVFVLSAGVAAAPWWGRNLAKTGNPFFPEATKILPVGSFSFEQVQRWEAAHRPRGDQQSLTARASAFGGQVLSDWRYGYLLIPAAAVSALLGRWDRQRGILLFVLATQAAMWLLATHLQGRFFASAIPVVAMLVASIPRERIGAGVACLAAMAAGASAILLLARLAAVPPAAFGVTDPAALWDLHPPAIARRLKTDSRPIALAGDARAFWWPAPMSRLTYRTVFDVDVRPGETVIDAWVRGRADGAIVVVDPLEIRRFLRTYRGLGDEPPEIAGRDEAFLREP